MRNVGKLISSRARSRLHIGLRPDNVLIVLPVQGNLPLAGIRMLGTPCCCVPVVSQGMCMLQKSALLLLSKKNIYQDRMMECVSYIIQNEGSVKFRTHFSMWSCCL